MRKSLCEIATRAIKFAYLPGYDPYRDAGDEYYYDAKAGNRAVSFIQNEIRLTKGRWKGKPFRLKPWQKDLVRCLFGWKSRKTGLRRYRNVFLYVPRKNGKSQLIAAIANYLLFCDGENDAEIYIGASNRAQALTLYKMAEEMLRQNADLWKEVRPRETTKEIIANWDNSKIQAISSDALSAHGYSPSAAIIDELHAQPNGALLEALRTGMGAREQPLMFYITTADLDRESICNDELEYAKAVRDGKIIDARYFPVVFETDKEADWTDPKVWAIANPTFPDTPSLDFLSGELVAAKKSRRLEASFKRLYLNMRTASNEGWLDMDAWRMGSLEFDEDELAGKKCYAGIDLSSKSDMTTLQLLFPDDWRVVSRFYLPRQALENDKSGHYQEWADAGLLTICGEEMVDYDYIMNDYLSLRKKFDIKETAIDSWNASYFIVRLEKLHGVTLTEYRQGILSFNEPSKELEVMIKAGRIRHNSPILDWMAANVSIKEDESGNIRPVKPKRGSPLKIDGIVALIMALGLCIRDKNEEPPASVYLKRGFIEI